MDGQTALHISACEGDELTVKYLHQYKANPNIVDIVSNSVFKFKI